jgi:hypothetical protein
MTIFDEFKHSVLTEIEIDPRPNFVRRVEGIIAREIPDYLPTEVANLLLDRRLAETYGRAKEVIESGHAEQLDSILHDFTLSLRTGVQWERDHGVLRVVTPADEIKRANELGWFEKFKWNAHETNCVLELLKLRQSKTGEREHIESVGYKSIVTDKREIHRGQFDALRLNSMTLDFWRKLGTPEQIIADAEAMEYREAAQEARPFRESAGPHQSLKGRFGQ